MSEQPTIDELIAQTDDYYHDNQQYVSRVYLAAIRFILEQHRDPKMFFATEEGVMRIGLECIRAFVERVEKRLPDYDTGRGADAMLKAYRQAVYDELTALEKESE